MPNEDAQARRAFQVNFATGRPTLWEPLSGDPPPSFSEKAVLQKTVISYLKSYLKTANTLTNEKYAGVRELIPTHLREPMAAMALCVDDGIIIRYERREPRCIGWSIMSGTIAQLTPLLSDNLATFGCDSSMRPEGVGVQFHLTKCRVDSPEHERILTAGVTFHAGQIQESRDPAKHVRPYCALSIHNALELELGLDVLTPERDGDSVSHIVTRTPVRLPVAWEAFEVYPNVEELEWNSNLAPIWAERDIEAALLRRALREKTFNDLDPKAGTRRELASLLSSFKELLDSNPEREEVLQQFLTTNPVLLHPAQRRVFPKLKIGHRVTDFVIQTSAGNYILIELEPSIERLFTKNDTPTARLTAAVNQIIDWKRYIEDHRSTVTEELGLDGISTNPESVVVIGRRQGLTKNQIRKLSTMNNQQPRIHIKTYDDIYDQARQTIENLVGPIGEAGGTTRIYNVPAMASWNPHSEQTPQVLPVRS